MDIENQSAII